MKRYYKSGGIKLFHGNCIRGLERFDDESVDTIITDPPYGINYASTSVKGRFRKIKNDNLPFIWWLHDAYRVLKDGGSIVCFTTWRVQEAFKMAMTCAGFEIRNQVVWDKKTHGMGNTKCTFGPQHELIWFATKGKFAFHDKRPVTVMSSMKVNSQKMVHPTEKPVPLMEELVEALVPEGGLVLDPFAGVCPVGVACINLGRRYTGIELEEDYIAIAKERCKQAQSEKKRVAYDLSAPANEFRVINLLEEG